MTRRPGRYLIAMRTYERILLTSAFNESGGLVAEMAERLDLNLRTLYRRLEYVGLQVVDGKLEERLVLDEQAKPNGT